MQDRLLISSHFSLRSWFPFESINLSYRTGQSVADLLLGVFWVCAVMLWSLSPWCYSLLPFHYHACQQNRIRRLPGDCLMSVWKNVWTGGCNSCITGIKQNFIFRLLLTEWQGAILQVSPWNGSDFASLLQSLELYHCITLLPHR